MTSFEMYQEFQVYMDSIDSQDLPEYEPEQIFIFLNLAVDEYIQAVRQAFESNSKIGDDATSLIKRVYISAEIEENRIKFDYNKARLTRSSDSESYVDIYYLLNGVIESTFLLRGDKIRKGITSINFVQQDDINPALKDPFNEPKFADKVPCVREDSAIYATPPINLTLETLIGTVLRKPAIINQTTNCDLREQVHKTIVKRATELALETVESPRVRTFNS